MGHCFSSSKNAVAGDTYLSPPSPSTSDNLSFPASPYPTTLPPGVPPSPAGKTPRRQFKWPLPPPSPAKPIMEALRRRKEGSLPETGAAGTVAQRPELDRSFGYSKNFQTKYEIDRQVGRGHFGYTFMAKAKKGQHKGEYVAVKIISKAKMTTPISIEDVRREVKILKGLSGHRNTLKFYDSFEDSNNVYIVTELCEGGELLDRILSRGGRSSEHDAKGIVVQILNGVAFCHLQGVVHRDLKPENFLFSGKSEDSVMKMIDFGLSDFVRPDQRLNDVVGSAYYVAPEVLHRSYSLEADIWSVGVITYILLCGSRPFWARTESGIFRSVIRTDPNFDGPPWPSISPEAKDFVRRLLNKDPRKRMTAAQALSHPWLRDETRAVPLDILIYKQVKSYICSTPFKHAALKALSRALTEDELLYLRAQFRLLHPKNGRVSFHNYKAALVRNVTDAMRESRVLDILLTMEPAHTKLDFQEFCAASISIYQLEALEEWETIATRAFEFFEQEGNRVISVQELAKEMNLGTMAHLILKNWIRSSDGKLSFLGYTKFLHGVTIRNSSNTRHQ